MTIVGCAIGVLFTDRFGRRPFMISGGLLTAVFLALGAGLGIKTNKTSADKETIIASFLLIGITTKISASNNAFLIGAEIGGVKMRKKIMAFGTACDVLAAFLVTFTVPYLLTNPGPNLGPNIGWIFARAAFRSFLFGVFFTPELARRSLEEVDELFDANLWARQFEKYETTGVGHRLIELERHDVAADEPKGGEDKAQEAVHQEIA
jgi:SP family sugar:H+ symporter-like MFS transporter